MGATSGADRARVLVVDDDALQRQGLADLLRLHDFDVAEAATGGEALRLAMQEAPDLVLLDVGLPDADGYDVCRRIKADRASPFVLLLSGLGARTEERVYGLDSGADGYLAKPVDPPELLAQVRAFLRIRRAEAAVARDTLLLANVRDAIVVTDPEGVVTYWNEGATRLFGWTAGEMLGRPLTDRVPEEGRAAMVAQLRNLRAGQENAGESEDYRKDGTRVWIDARVSRITDPSGRAAGFLALAHDVSERRLLEARYRQAQKIEAVGQLAGGIAHDFNNLMQGIIGYGELVLNDLPEGSPAGPLLWAIIRAGERASALTRRLLAFSRQSALAPERLDLNAVVHDADEMLHRVLGGQIAYATSLGQGLGAVFADRGQLEQVLVHLAENARDAMPQGGRFTVATANAELGEGHVEVRPGPYVRLALHDTGPGMTEEAKAHLFEPFFTTKPQGKGTGLGLAMVYGAVKQAGGHVEVESEAGAGTTVTIYLPRA
jgi:two-component system cell cycle sensor histidine kinase/response regulator CckA